MPSTTASSCSFVSDDFLVRQRAELAARRASYREQMERLAAAAGDGVAQADSPPAERDRVLSLTARARRGIDEIDDALRRLDRGTYGACRSCRRPIPAVRLEAVPEATQCVSCANGTALRRRWDAP